MDQSKSPLVELRFSGGIYDSCALDDRALEEVVKVMRAISDTAKARWKLSHPHRERLPRRFTDSLQVHMHEIRSGSTIVILDRSPTAGQQLDLFDNELSEAVKFMGDAYDAVSGDTEPPSALTPSLCDTYAQLGSRLPSGATLAFVPANRRPTRINDIARVQFRRRLPNTVDDIVDVIGRVLAADVHRHTFQLWLSMTESVNAIFSPEQEDQITAALHEHDSIELRVRGFGRYRSDGEIYRIDRVDSIDDVSLENWVFDPTAPTVSEMVTAAFAAVPDDEWGSLPQDLAARHDDYFSAAH